MMKVSESKCWASLIVVLCGLGFLSPSPADQSSDVEYNRRSQYAEMVDEEKRLMKADDDLSRVVWDLKQAINELHSKLDAAQDKLDTVRHRLITVRMKLMP
jgi:uncharacterized protein YlxW (UPF0749 family)